MLRRIFGAKTHTYLHVLGLSGLAFGLPFNKVVMSISMMFLVLNLLIEGDFKTYWTKLKSNRGFILILSLILLTALSVFWSTDTAYGLHDLKAKLPLLVIPVVLAAKPIYNSKFINIILISFVGSVMMTSTINYGAYSQCFGSIEYDDIRGMSLFSSHVRYALLVVMSVAILIHFLVKKQGPILLWIVLLIWLNYYTYFSQILSGAITLLGIYSVILFYWIWNKQKLVALIGLFSVLITTTVMIVIVFKPITYNPADYTYKTLGRRTAEGNIYYHKPGIVSPETGKPIHIFISEIELKREWEKVSDIPFEGLDVKGQQIKSTMIRYMASKDLKKDAVGFSKLTKKDIESIENGCTTVHYKGMIARIYGLKYQLSNVSDPNGHSFLQRLEYWKTGAEIAKKNWIIGVGTGDAQLVFNHQYYINKSILREENRDRSHNMYLTVLLTIGIVGLVLLLWSHIRFFVLNFKSGQIVAVLFMSIVLLSYFMEDTLETQTGVTFFALFYGLFFNFSKKEQIS